jgi:hypothetical protein
MLKPARPTAAPRGAAQVVRRPPVPSPPVSQVRMELATLLCIKCEALQRVVELADCSAMLSFNAGSAIVSGIHVVLSRMMSRVTESCSQGLRNAVKVNRAHVHFSKNRTPRFGCINDKRSKKQTSVSLLPYQVLLEATENRTSSFMAPC